LTLVNTVDQIRLPSSAPELTCTTKLPRSWFWDVAILDRIVAILAHPIRLPAHAVNDKGRESLASPSARFYQTIKYVNVPFRSRAVT